MTTALARHKTSPADVVEVALHEGKELALPEMGFSALLDLATNLVASGFLSDFIKTPAQAVAIILTGRELGMGPMRSLRSLQMVKGKVVENADSQLARFKTDGGHAVFKRLDEHGAVLWMRHPNGDEHTESFGPEDARRAKLTGDNYQKYPLPIYRSRAITAGLKSIGWEGGAGAYDPKEAAAFTPPALQTRAAAAPEPTPIPATETALQRALAYPLPGKPEAWGGFGGQPLAVCSFSLLRGIAEWVAKKLDEEPNDRLTDLLAQVDLVIEARESGDVEEPGASGNEEDGS